jgi:hypothetical protein
MIEPGHKKLSIRRQARLLGVNRNRLKKKPHPPRADRASDLEVLAALDRLHTRWPFYGQRKLKKELDKLGLRVNRKRLRRLMEEAGIEATGSSIGSWWIRILARTCLASSSNPKKVRAISSGAHSPSRVPDAGNPQVRFDEWERRSGTAARCSLLY